MATVFPTSLDSLVNPTASDSLATVNHADQHANANDAIEALQAKVGINSSAVTTSLDYLVRNINASTAIVSGSSAGDLVRITQTGAGNALVVEDSANPDSTPFVITGSGIVKVLTPNSYSNLNVDGSMAVHGANTTLNFVDASNTRLGYLNHSGAHLTLMNQAVNGWTYLGTEGANRVVINPTGNVGIGTAPSAGRTLTVSQPITGATSGTAVFSNGEVQSDVTASASIFRTLATTQNAVFTLPTIRHFLAAQGALGASSTITEQIGFLADSSLTGAGTNYAFYGNIASGTGRWNLYMGGTADNYMAGSLGVGSTSLTGRRVVVAGNLTGAVTSVGLSVVPTIQSDVTSNAYIVNTNGITSAASFTLSSLQHFRADQGTLGAGSTVTDQIGFIAGSSLTGATNNYGFYGNIASGTGRWNLYMAGTAANYLAGRLGVGATLTSGTMMRVTNTTAADIALTVKGAASQTGLLLDIENSAGTTLSAFDSSGRLIVGSSSVVAFGLATPSAQVLGTSASASAVLQGRYSADANSPTLYFAKSRNATVGSHTIVQSGDSLGRINFGGSDGTDFSNSAAIYVEAEGTLAAGVIQSRFVFHNQGSGGALAERMRLDSSGNLLVGITSIATSSAKTIHIGNGTAPTANPTSGGVLYVESGALKYRGSSGTVTTIANA